MSSNFSSNCEFNQNLTENASNIACLGNPLQTSLDTHINSTNKSFQIQYENISPNINNNQQMIYEKEKLFQDFLIFQNFMKMQSLMKNNPTHNFSEVSFVNFENMNKRNLENNPQKMHSRVEIENPIKLIITQSNKDVSREFLKTEEKVEEKKEKPSIIDNQQLIINNKEGKAIKFDDIPIKPNSHNFIELLEKQLNNNTYTARPEQENNGKFLDKDKLRYKSNTNIKKIKRENKSLTEKTENNDKNEKIEEVKKKDNKIINEHVKEDILSEANCSIQRDNYRSLNKSNSNQKNKQTVVARSLDFRNDALQFNGKNNIINEKGLEKSYSFSSKKGNYSNRLFNSQKNSPTKEKETKVIITNKNFFDTNQNTNNIIIQSNKKNHDEFVDSVVDKNNVERSSAYKTKKEYEKLIESLNQERKLFNEQKIREKKEFEVWKANELNKIKSKTKSNNTQEVTSLKNKLQAFKDKEKQYQTTIDNIKKELYNQQNIIVSLNSKLKHYEELLKIDNIGNKINSKKEREKDQKEKEKFLLNEEYDDIKLKEVKAIKKEYMQNKPSSEDEKELIDYDNLQQDDHISEDNSLSDIDEKRSFDERSIKIKNHVPQINKLNIVQIPKKNLRPYNSRIIKADEMKVEYLSLNKNDENNNLNQNTQQDTSRYKRAGTTSKIQSASKPNEKNSEKTESESSCSWDIKFPEKYHSSQQQNSKIVKHEKGTEGKVYLIYENGKKEVIFPNGIRKLIFEDGYSIVYLNNKDIKQTYPDGKVVYYFYKDKITQTSFNNGLKVVKFHNGQIEKYFPDGSKEITFPDGTTKIINAGDEK